MQSCYFYTAANLITNHDNDTQQKQEQQQQQQQGVWLTLVCLESLPSNCCILAPPSVQILSLQHLIQNAAAVFDGWIHTHNTTKAEAAAVAVAGSLEHTCVWKVCRRDTAKALFP